MKVAIFNKEMQLRFYLLHSAKPSHELKIVNIIKKNQDIETR